MNFNLFVFVLKCVNCILMPGILVQLCILLCHCHADYQIFSWKVFSDLIRQTVYWMYSLFILKLGTWGQLCVRSNSLRSPVWMPSGGITLMAHSFRHSKVSSLQVKQNKKMCIKIYSHFRNLECNLSLNLW